MVTKPRQQDQISHRIFVPLASRNLRRVALSAYLISSTMVVPGVSRSSAEEAASLIAPSPVIHAVANESTEPNQILQVSGRDFQNPKSTPSRTLLSLDRGRNSTNPPASQARTLDARRFTPSAVVPAGGILGGLFGEKERVAKKEHEDGRKATALPPPDPKTVDWDGIPFHQPLKGEIAESSKTEPIRDYSANVPQRSTASPVRTTPSRTTPPRTPSSQSSTATGSGVANQSIPPVPTSRPSSSVPSANANLRRAPGEVSTPSQPVSSSRRDVNPIPPVPLNTTKNAFATRPPSSSTTQPYASEISSSDSTRRMGRRTVTALDPESTVTSPNDAVAIPSRSASLTEPLAAPSVPRRELMPIEPSITQLSKNTRKEIESLPLLPKAEPSDAPDNSGIPLVPRSSGSLSMEDSWNSVGSGIARTPSTTETTRPSTTATMVPAKSVSAQTGSGLSGSGLSSSVARTEAPSPTSSTNFGPSSDQAEPNDARADSERALRDALTSSKPSQPPASTTSANNTPAPVKPAVTEAVVRRPETTSSKMLGSSELPGVRVVTEGPSEIMIRELTQYEVRVENRGAIDATGIIVRSSLPPWAEVMGNNASIGSVKTIDQSGQAQLQWSIDKLPAGVVERLFVRVKAVKAGTFDVTTDWTILPQKHVASVKVREPKLAVVIDGPDEIVYGRSEKYRVRVMNPGDGDAANVVFTLSPDSKNPQAQKIGAIPAGKEAQFEIELTARELGELKIGGLATADREVKTTANKAIRIAAAAVEAELTGPPLKYQNSNANYHLLLTNTGKAVCEAMQAEVRLPSGVTYISGIPQANFSGDRLTWKIDAMQPGAVREYDLVCRMDRTGDMVIGFNCAGSASGRASVSIETRVEAIADLVLSIGDPMAPAPVNADVYYEMTIHNRGSKAAEDVKVIAQFSNGIEPIRIEGHSGEVITGQVLFNPISRIEPGTTVKLKVTARADKAGDHRFRTEVRHGDFSHVAEESTMYLEAPAERISRRSTSK